MKIALCQFDQAWEDKKANQDRIRTLLRDRPSGRKFDWIVFPEMTLSAFTMDAGKAELVREDEAFFSGLAREMSAHVSFGGVEGGYNKLITLDADGRRVSEYSKINLYAFGQEDRHYKAGGRRERFALKGFSVVPAVCYDLRFPGIFWDAAEQAGLYVVIANWPMRRAEHWTTLLRARAVENQCYVAGVNRTGRDPAIEYSGNSAVFDPLGKTVLDCGVREGVYEAELDPELVTRTRTRFPFLKDRKPLPAAA